MRRWEGTCASKSPSLFTKGRKVDLGYRPEKREVEDWSRAKPVKQELLVPANSEAAKNIQNPKVLHMLGVESVTKFDMLSSVRTACFEAHRAPWLIRHE